MQARFRRISKQWVSGLLIGVLPLLASTSFAQLTSAASTTRIRRTALVSIPDRKLALLEGDRIIAEFPVSVGAAVTPSPEGEFEIVSRLENPTYYHAGVVVPPGKDNPVGTRWLGLNLKGYGIHGTNVPRSIGRASSHGCIRLRNRDVERLYPMLHVGDVVEIHGERDERIAAVFGQSGTILAARAHAETLVSGGGQ